MVDATVVVKVSKDSRPVDLPRDSKDEDGSRKEMENAAGQNMDSRSFRQHCQHFLSRGKEGKGVGKCMGKKVFVLCSRSLPLFI